MSSTSFDALLNFDQETIRNVVHKTLPAPRGCRTSSAYYHWLYIKKKRGFSIGNRSQEIS